MTWCFVTLPGVVTILWVSRGRVFDLEQTQGAVGAADYPRVGSL